MNIRYTLYNHATKYAFENNDNPCEGRFQPRVKYGYSGPIKGDKVVPVLNYLRTIS
jgi:hypothetical protein